MTKILGVELKPCPFCGATNMETERWPAGGYTVVCMDCGSAGPYDLGKSGAAERWNERKEAEALNEDRPVDYSEFKETGMEPTYKMLAPDEDQ